MTTYKEFTKILAENPQYLVDFYLPNKAPNKTPNKTPNKAPNKLIVPMHYHITDVGAIQRHFIDCGGHTREENYVQIQLWLGKDTEHRVEAQTILKILEQSAVILKKLPDLENSPVFIEYKSEFISQYPVKKIETSDKKIVCHTDPLTTQCLAALRHEKETSIINPSSCCPSKCCA